MARPDPRVLFISSHAQLGGSERHLQRLLERLPASCVAGVVALAPGPLVDALTGYEVDVVPTGAGLSDVLRAARVLRRSIRAVPDPPDVIHANGVKAAAVSVLAAGRSVPVVWNKHDHAFDGRRGRWIASRCAAVVGVSESAVRAVRSSAKTVRVVPPVIELPAVDAQRGRRALERMIGSMDGPVLLSVGRLDRAKGQLDLVEALPAVRERWPAVVVLLGAPEPAQPDYLQTIRARAAALGVSDAVVLVGFREDAGDIVAAASVVVITSQSVRGDGMGAEGFGLVAVEAMAAGVPVVAYAEGAIPELLGECGSLVASKDVRSLAAAIGRVLESQALAGRMAECGRRRAQRVLREADTVASLREVYQAVSTGRRSMPTA